MVDFFYRRNGVERRFLKLRNGEVCYRFRFVGWPTWSAPHWTTDVLWGYWVVGADKVLDDPAPDFVKLAFTPLKEFSTIKVYPSPGDEL